MKEIPKSIKASLYIDGKPAEASIKNIRQVTNGLKKDLDGLTVGTDAWNAKMKELQLHEKTLNNIKNEVKGVNGAFSFIKSEVGKLGVLAAGYLGFQFISDQFQNIITSNAKLSDSFADVRKTTGLNEESVRRLNNQFKDFNTRTTRQELLGLAEVAGKLGISAEADVLGFVKAADQIKVALGKDLGDAEGAINDLGKLTDLFKLKDQFGLEQALIKTGSAINALGAAGTANEGYIVEFTKRLGTIAPAANISIENVLGLAATMDELGQPAEAATTALGQFIIGMGKDLPTFAKVANMSVQEFSDLLRNDANAALIAVLTQLKTTGGGVSDLATKMGLIGEDGARATAALSALAGGIDKLKDRQALSNKEFGIGTSLTNEFNIKNNNLASTLDKISKWFYGVATSKVISGTLTILADGFARLIGVTRTNSEELEKQRIELNKLEFQITSTNTKQSERIRLINELKAQYPTLLANLNAEKATNEEIAKAIKSVNDQLINKIILAKKDEEISKENENSANLRMKLLETEDKIRERLAKLRDKFPEFKLPDGTEAEKLASLVDQYQESQNKLGKSTGGVFDPTFGVGKLLNNYEALSEMLDSANKKTGKMLDARNDLIKRLGIEEVKPSSSNTPPQTNTSPYTRTLTKEELDEQEKAKKKAIKLFDEAELERIASLERTAQAIMDSYAKELSEVDEHFRKLKNKHSTNAAAVNQIEQERLAKLKNLEEKFRKDDLAKLQAVQNEISQLSTQAMERETDRLLSELQQETREKLQLFDQEDKEIRERVEKQKQSVIELKKSQKNEEAQILEDAIARELLLLDASGKLREAFLKKQGKKEVEILKDAANNKKLSKLEADLINAESADDENGSIKAKLALLKFNYDLEIEAAERLGKDTTAITAKYIAQKLALENTAEKKKNELILEGARVLSDSSFRIINDSTQRASDARISAIERERDRELSNKELTDAQKYKINQKFDERVRREKERSWKAEQRAAIAQALINGAIAMTKVSAQTGVLSFAFSPLIAAQVAAQVAVIAAQKMPQFAMGGFSDSDPEGYVGQPTIFRKSASGRPFVAGEAGREWIAPNWMLQDTRFANIIGMLEAARIDKRAFASGGMTGIPPASPMAYDFTRIEALLGSFVETQSKLNSRRIVLPVQALDDLYEDRDRINLSINS